MFMNKYRIGILFIIAAVILGVVITITSTINEIDLDNIEEYGTMEVYETALKVNSSTVSSALNETENKNKIDEKHEVAEISEYDWFLSFRSFYNYAMSKQGQLYESDADYISECLNKMCKGAILPSDDLNTYYESLEHLDIDSAIVGDLVFFFDENGNAVHMGVKGYNNHMYDLKDGKVIYEYISDDGRNFAFARVISEIYDKDEMEIKQEQTGYRHAELYAAEGNMDLSVFDDFKERLLTELNIKFSDTHPKIPIKGFYVVDIDENAYNGRALSATVACGELGMQYVVRYIYDVDKLYIL